MDTAQLFERSLFELLGRSIAPLHFKSEKVAGTSFAHGNFVGLRLDFLGLGGYFPVPEALN